MRCDHCPFYWEISSEDGHDWGCEVWGQEPPEEIELDFDGVGGCPILVQEGKKIIRLGQTIKYSQIIYYPTLWPDPEKIKAENARIEEDAKKANKAYDEYFPKLMEKLKARARKFDEKEERK